jgi:surface protein
MKRIINLFIFILICSFFYSFKPSVVNALDNIEVTNFSCENISRGELKRDLKVKVDGLSINFYNAYFYNLGDNLQCTFEVKNNSDHDIEINSKSITSLSNDYLKYTMYADSVIRKGKTNTYKLKIEYIKLTDNFNSFSSDLQLEFVNPKGEVGISHNFSLITGDAATNMKTSSGVTYYVIIGLFSIFFIFILVRSIMGHKNKEALILIIALFGTTLIISSGSYHDLLNKVPVPEKIFDKTLININGTIYTDGIKDEQVLSNTLISGPEFNKLIKELNLAPKSFTRLKEEPSQSIKNNAVDIDIDPDKKSVYMWDSGDGKILYYSESKTIYLNENCKDMFNIDTIEEIDFTEVDSINVTTMESMFANSKIKSLKLNNFDTSNVTNMKNMFNYCSSLEYLDISSFNTIKVVDFSGMFFNVDISKLNAANEK